MRERQGGEPPADARHVAGLVARLAGVPEALVREQHTLRPTGRAAGVEERGRVRVVPRDDLRRSCLLERGERDGSVAGLGARDPADALDAFGRRANGAHELGRGDHAACAGVAQDVVELLGREQEDRGRDDGAGAPDRVVRHRHLGAVGRQHADAVAGLETLLKQTTGQPAPALEQVAGAVPAALEHQRLVVAEPGERFFGEPPEVVLSRHAATFPRPFPSARPCSRGRARPETALSARRAARPAPSARRSRGPHLRPTAGAR
jgi:hypothetical protein